MLIEGLLYLSLLSLLLLTLCHKLANLGLEDSSRLGVPSNADVRFFLRVLNVSRTGSIVCASILAGLLAAFTLTTLL